MARMCSGSIVFSGGPLNILLPWSAGQPPRGGGGVAREKTRIAQGARCVRSDVCQLTD